MSWCIKARFTVHTACCTALSQDLRSSQKVSLEEGFLDAVRQGGQGQHGPGARWSQVALIMEEKTALFPASLQPEWTRVQVETPPSLRALSGLVSNRAGGSIRASCRLLDGGRHNLCDCVESHCASVMYREGNPTFPAHPHVQARVWGGELLPRYLEAPCPSLGACTCS